MKRFLLCLLCANFLGLATAYADDEKPGDEKERTSLSCDDCRRKVTLVSCDDCKPRVAQNDDTSDERPS